MTEIWILDAEASGLDRRSYPIEIGVAGPAIQYEALIVPEPGWTAWDVQAQAIHGIDRQSLYRHGKPAREVAIELNQLLDDKTVFSDCLRWDAFWIHVLFGAVGVTPSFTLADLETLLSDQVTPAYFREYEALCVSGLYRQHRAADDARMIRLALCLAYGLGCKV